MQGHLATEGELGIKTESLLRNDHFELIGGQVNQDFIAAEERIGCLLRWQRSFRGQRFQNSDSIVAIYQTPRVPETGIQRRKRQSSGPSSLK